MMRMLATEVLKTKRSMTVAVILASAILPSALAFAESLMRGTAALAFENSGLWSFGAFLALTLGTCQVFSREYQGNTIQVLFATPRPAAGILAAKLIASALLVVAAAALGLAFGLLFSLATRAGLPTADRALGYLRGVGLAAVQFVLLVPYTALVAILCRKMFTATVIIFAVFILFFPFGMTDSYYLIPPIIPTTRYALAFGFAPPDRGAMTPGWVSLGAFFVVCLSLCIARFRRA